MRAPETRSEQDGVVEAEQVLADVHARDQRQRGRDDAPEEQAEAELLQAGDELRPDERPTMAMNTFKPTEFMNQTVGDGIRPNVGRTERSQPKKRPAINAPPEVDKRERHAADVGDERADQGADGDGGADEHHVGHVRRLVRVARATLVATVTSWVRPTRVRMSPRLISVSGRIGISVAVAPRVILRR